MNRAPEILNPAVIDRDNEFARHGPTLNAMLVSVTSAAFLPAVLLFVAWQLDPPYRKQELQGAIGFSLITAAIPMLFVVLVISRSLSPNGLAERFLRWSPNVCQAILSTTRPVAWLGIPLLWFYTAVESFAGGKWNDSLGRLAFVLAMLVLSSALWKTGLRIRKYCQACSENHQEQGLGFWTRSLLASVAVCPLLLALLSAAGYHFTAVQLSWRLYWTLAIITGIALLTSFTSRTLLIMQFRTRQRQTSDCPVTGDDGQSLDISEITSQVNRLLRVMALVGVVVVGWQVWSGVLPAIGYLDSIELWDKYSKDGTPDKATLRDVLLSAGILGITIVLSRNLPGILEIVLLDRLPLDRGGRYAISFVCRYVVGISGLMLMFRMLGFSWSTVQWLAAGLTVGLGFGLQEIFANLVSGLIILIERPVRVGDFVTVNGVSGHVMQMQLRATTIKDLDSRELIVPNKRFITEDVINWTLSDRSTRVIIRVGIAYGSDTKKAQQVLLEVARANPLVKNLPMPEVIFSAFGDSTLDFELRVIIPTREVYFRVVHELNMAIDQAFRESGIEIAFPQRDIHVRGLPEALSSLSAQQTPESPQAGEPVPELKLAANSKAA